MAQTPVPSITAEGQAKIENLWGLGSCTFKGVKHSENHTYLIEAPEKRFIIRLTPQSHRTRKAVQAEVDYVLFLARAGSGSVHVCPPIPLASNPNEFIALVAPYGSDEEWLAVVFEHAKGSHVLDNWRGVVDDKIIQSLGHAMGSLHQLISTKCGQPDKWRKMEEDIPQRHQTHGGATDVPTIRSRAESGHATSKQLLKIWEEKLSPFLSSLGEPNDAVYGVVHGDLNVSNFFAEDTEENGLPRLWLFDFDQIHHNWFGFDVGVVLAMCQFFAENGVGPIAGFDRERFRDSFLNAYKKSYPKMVELGHMEPHVLDGFQLYREFYHTAVAVDILFQAEKGKQFEAAITGFCEVVVKRFQSNFLEA